MKYSFYNQLEKPWPNKRLKNGVIIGHTTTTTARIWLRTAKKESSCRLVLVPVDYKDKEKDKNLSEFLKNEKLVWEEFEKNFPDNLSRDAETSSEQDFTKVLNFTDLQPATRYRYFLADASEESDLKLLVNPIPAGAGKKAEKRTGLSACFYFQTLPAEKDESFSFGLFSCHNPYVDSKNDDHAASVQGMEAWESFALNLHRHRSRGCKECGDDLAFVIGGGDQCYVDGREAIDIWKYLYKVMHFKDGELYPSQKDMVSWYRNIYRGYWGFPQVKTVFGMYPTYMTWDDHEIGDGWGSFDDDNEHKIYEKAEEDKSKGITRERATELLKRMFQAARQVYIEYQHSHNPDSPKGELYYNFSHSNAHFYVLDGRGHRDVTRPTHKILGKPQLEHFKKWANDVNDGVMFVVSAVPMLHAVTGVVEHAGKAVTSLADDLKDAWEHSMHEQECVELMETLWAARERGVKVCILSGDVHASALFEIEKGGKKIYQITSSAITYHLRPDQRFVLWTIVADKGETTLGAKHKRLAYSNRSSYAMIKVHKEGCVDVSFYDALAQAEIKDGKMETVLASMGTHRI